MKNFLSGDDGCAGLLLEQGFEAGCDHFHRNRVQAPFGDDDIGVALGGFDELQVHGADGGEVLVDDHFGGAAALFDVALEAADEADVGIGVDEDLDIEQGAQFGVAEDEDALDHDDGFGRDALDAVGAGVGLEVVDGQVDGLPGFELEDVADEEGGVERVGVVEVDLFALVVGQIAQVAVVGVVGEVGDAPGADTVANEVGEGGLARTAAPGDPDHERVGSFGHGIIIPPGRPSKKRIETNMTPGEGQVSLPDEAGSEAFSISRSHSALTISRASLRLWSNSSLKDCAESTRWVLSMRLMQVEEKQSTRTM